MVLSCLWLQLSYMLVNVKTEKKPSNLCLKVKNVPWGISSYCNSEELVLHLHCAGCLRHPGKPVPYRSRSLNW